MEMPGDLDAEVHDYSYLDWTGKAIAAMGDEQTKIIKNQIPGVRVLKRILGSTIRDQHNQHVCWAVAAAAATEAVNNLNRSRDYVWEASPQELIDHAQPEEDTDPNSGLSRMFSAWDYVLNHKLSQEKHYPYEEGVRNYEADLQGKESREIDELLQITGFHEVETVNEVALLRLLHAQPVVGIFESNVAMEYWDGLGIFHGDGSVERRKDFEILKSLKGLNSREATEVKDVKGKGKGKGKGKAQKVAIEEENEEIKDEQIAAEDRELLKLIKIRKRGPATEYHAALIVGFGTSSTNKHYFLIRNSYGERWGMKGFGKIMRALSLGHDSSGRQKASLVKAYSYPVLQG